MGKGTVKREIFIQAIRYEGFNINILIRLTCFSRMLSVLILSPGAPPSSLEARPSPLLDNQDKVKLVPHPS